MSDGALLKRFDLIADFPDNIPFIRRYIIDLAIRGRLVAPSDETLTSEELFNKLSLQARVLRSTAIGKKTKSMPAIEIREIPASYVNCCVFERLGNIATLSKGQTGIQAAKPGSYPLVVTAADRATCDHYDFDGAAAIIPMVSSTGHGHASLNRLHYQEGKFALGSILCAVFPIDETLISARFLFEYLTAFKEMLLVSRMIGTANVTLTLSKIAEIPIPLISPSIQMRVDQLMELCDQLHDSQIERDQYRDRLVAASLQRLNHQPVFESDKDLATNTKFYLNHISKLTTKVEHVNSLRTTIFNLVVQGRLVARQPEEEPVEQALSHSDSVRNEVALSDRRASAVRQDLLGKDQCWKIPAHWSWRALADLVLFIDYRGQTPNKIEAGVRLITAKNVKPGVINKFPEEFISEDEYVTWMTRGIPEVGDVLFTTEAPMGSAAVVDFQERFALAQRVINFRSYGALVPEFLVLQLRSQPFFGILESEATGLTVKGIKAAKLKCLPIAVPPLAEQHRIVARAHELLRLCDQLETELISTYAQSKGLIENILDRALGINRIVDQKKPRDQLFEVPAPDSHNERTSSYMPSSPVLTIDQLVGCVDELDGNATPDRLLKYSGLSEDLESFYDLLREARDIGALEISLGSVEAIRRFGNAN
jgi:type I restriction enzyme S subunit